MSHLTSLLLSLSPSLLSSTSLYIAISIFSPLPTQPIIYIHIHYLSLCSSHSALISPSSPPVSLFIPLPVFLSSPPILLCNYLLRLKPERICSDWRLVSPPFAALLSSSRSPLFFNSFSFPFLLLLFSFLFLSVTTSYTCNFVYASIMSGVDLVSCISIFFSVSTSFPSIYDFGILLISFNL